MTQKHKLKNWQLHLNEIIFGAETTSGKVFDIFLIASIIISVIAVMLDSVTSINLKFGNILNYIEWTFTILFTFEYLLRLLCVGRSIKYAFSFFGIIDLLAIIPTYLSLFLPGTHFFMVIRILRVLRIFRVLKLVQYVGEANMLIQALKESSRKITLFLFTVIVLIIVFGSLIYIIEGEENGFTSIPRSIYWAIVTMTTVGYGDMSPKTNLGQALAAVVMIIGYSIVVVPTGIVTAEITRSYNKKITNHSCTECGSNHGIEAVYCERCGVKL